MARVGAEELAGAVDVEEFYFGVSAGGEEEVRCLGEEADGVYGFGAVLPRVDVLFGDVIWLAADFFVEVDVDISRGVHVCPALVVDK